MKDLHLAVQAEDSLAGCLLVEPAATLQLVEGIVSSDDFVSGTARAIFNAVSDLVHAEKPVDPVLIQAAAGDAGAILATEHVADLMRRFVTTADAAETARIVHEAAQKRRGQEIGFALAEGDLQPVEALERLQTLLRGQGSRVRQPGEAAQRFLAELVAAASGKHQPFLATGFQRLDRQLSGGFAVGGLITIAARPGTGKTTAALNLAENVAASGKAVLYVSLEMTERQLWDCRCAIASGLSRSAIASGKILESDYVSWKKVSDAVELLYCRPFLIRDVPSTLEDIEREARCCEGLSLLVIDHIGLIKPTQRGSRYEVMTEAAHRLKQLALSLKIPVLALCQLNRQSEQRESKRPTMADLRDSGAIEEDSDVVILLFREAVYLPEDERPKPWEAQALDFIVDKNRHGLTGRVEFDFYGMTSRLVERRCSP